MSRRRDLQPVASRPSTRHRRSADRPYGGVHRLLEDAGATFRSRGGTPRRTES
ncbi:helix-turn-helix domain-containing protein [Streptomyces eurythermus]